MIEAADGRAALECVARQKPGLIVLDLMMPGMDGFDFIAALRQVEEWREIPIVVLTAKEVSAEERAAARARRAAHSAKRGLPGYGAGGRNCRSIKGDASAVAAASCRRRTTEMALLIVDDEESNRDMLSRRLQRQGFEVTLAEDGPQALDCHSPDQTPDMVLLDIRMPGMSGMQVLQAIRERYSPTQLPVIMVTAEGQSASIVEALQTGRQRLHHQAGGHAGGAGAHSHAALAEDAVGGLARERGALRPRGARRQRRLVGLGPGEGRDLLLAALERDAGLPRTARSASGPTNGCAACIRTISRACRPRSRRTAGGRPRNWTASTAYTVRTAPIAGCCSRGLAVWNGSGEAIRIAGSQTDITAAKVADPLTGLPNRLLFMDRLERRIELYQRQPEREFAVLLLDVDRFKNVNDSLGHTAGDLLLKALAGRLREGCAPPTPWPGCRKIAASRAWPAMSSPCCWMKSGKAGDAVVGRRAHRRGDARAFLLNGHEVFVTASIGIAGSANGYERAEDLMRDADTALHCAKTARPCPL